MHTPTFSIVVTTYERAQIVGRCVESCLTQSFPDFELVVVDDGSADDTTAVLGGYGDARLRVIAHERNRGTNPARHTSVRAARGEWVVALDSDDELLPRALERMRELIEELPPGVRVLRARQLHDDGTVTPGFVPAGPYGYEGRIRWAEAEGGTDAARCLRREVFETTPYIDGRRGAMEPLFELNLAQAETSVCVEDVLTRVHADAPNSILRERGGELIPRLLREAPDMLWMARATLERHGPALRRWGPRQYRGLLRLASMQAFLLGKRGLGMRLGLAALRCRPLDPETWATLALGAVGPRALAHGAAAHRKLSR